MITIPTTELIGGITDVLPIVLDSKAETAGVRITWDGDELTFGAFDERAAGQVTWIPGMGAEGEYEATDQSTEKDDIDWGGNDSPWDVFIPFDSAKEILKLFRLPAKLWRTPVTIEPSPSRTTLHLDRTDGPRSDRHLRVPTINHVLSRFPDIRKMWDMVTDVGFPGVAPTQRFAIPRLGAFGGLRLHGDLGLHFGTDEQPVVVTAGSRFIGYVYRVTGKPGA